MSAVEESLRQKIRELEQQLAARENLLHTYRLQLTKTNKQLEALISQVNHELKAAHQIQKWLSPTELPKITGFEFSTKFSPGLKQGGDYFDIFEHEDRFKFGVILSSASGYGVSALFLSILMKISSRLESRKGFTPGESLEKIFFEMKPQLGAQDRAHLFFGLFDRRTFELHYAAVGDVLVYRQRFKQDRLEDLSPHSEGLHAQHLGQVQTQKVSLEAQDRLILVSPGVVLAENQRGEVFGRDRLISAIRSRAKAAVHDLRNEILFQVEQFTGQVEAIRDRTVLVVEIKESMIKLVERS